MKFSNVRRSTRLLVVSLLVIGVSFETLALEPAIPPTSFLLDGITNAAGNLLSRAVSVPRTLLKNATRITTNYIDSAASVPLDYSFHKILEKFRSRMQQGFPEFRVPVLEPLRLNQLYLRTQSLEIGNITLYFDDLRIDRLSTFNIDRARLSLVGPTITVNLTFPTVLVNGYYNISGNIGKMFLLTGSGKLSARVSDLRVYFKTVLGFSRGLYMQSFDLDVSVAAVRLKLENFMGGNEIGRIMTEVFQEVTPQALEIIKPEILPPIQEFIVGRANETLYNLSAGEAMAFLTGKGEKNHTLPWA